MSNTQDYQAHYSDSGFWSKTKLLGKKVLTPALKLYYAAQDKDTPSWAKAVIYGALGYFIFPVDAIPDMLPVVGYTDDITVLISALTVVAAHVKQAHEELALQTLARWCD